MWSDSILIICISIFTACLGELVTWALVYRTENYKKLKIEIEKQSKKCKKFLIIKLRFELKGDVEGFEEG